MIKTILTALVLLPTLLVGEVTVEERILELRKIRKEQIQKQLEEIHKAHLVALLKLKSTTSPLEGNSEVVKEEIRIVSELTKITFPKQLQFPIPTSTEQKEYEKPRLRKVEEITEFLVGSHWKYFTNAEVAGEPTDLVFVNDKTVKIGDKEFFWKVKEDKTVWIANEKMWGGTTLEFSDKTGKTLVGATVSNGAHKRSASWK